MITDWLANRYLKMFSGSRSTGVPIQVCLTSETVIDLYNCDWKDTIGLAGHGHVTSLVSSMCETLTLFLIVCVCVCIKQLKLLYSKCIFS